MAKTTKKQENKVVTRAEKTDATKNVIQELLAVNPQKHNELIEETAKIYITRFGGEDTENVNDVKGRVGSVLDIMKKGDEIVYDGGRYALKPRSEEISTAENREIAAENIVETATEKKPVKKTRKTKKTDDTEENKTEVAKKTVKKSVKTEKSEKAAKTAKEKEDEKTQPLPPAPLQPIAPVVPVTPETLPEKEKTEEKPVKKPVSARGKKTETKSKTENEDVSKTNEGAKDSAVDDAAETPSVKKNEVIDVSFLFGETAVKKAEKASGKTSANAIKKAENTPAKTENKTENKAENSVREKPAEINKTPILKVVKTEEKRAKKVVQTLRKAEAKPQTADERLREAFLRKLRSLGGDYFEYYSVYLLERYSMKNGRRLESMRISGGDRDGGIDGEIELTDKLGFRETIYIQSKNWNPDKGDERLWVVGETLLQQFIGACACRQAQDKRQNCRGIFVTTSRFTPDAKRILETMSDKIVGYDGEDLYEAAKECRFGVVFENGNWKLDEKLLSGTKAFFNML